MKILIYGINYSPEPLGVGKYTGEMAEKLSADGHEVRVVTALPYYPEWKVAPGYARWKYVTESQGRITVHRAPLWVPKFPKGRKRVLHLMSFAFTSLPLLLRMWAWKPDLVWMAAPSMMCAPAALLTAKVCGAKSWIHVQDYEVDIAFGLGVIPSGFAKRTAFAFESWMLRRFTRVSSISTSMVALAISKGVKKDDLVLVPNWVDIDKITPLAGISPYRKELGISPDATVALYSGTMGMKQGIDWLAEVAIRLADVPNLVFVFCGDGQQKAQAQAACGHLPSVTFIPLQPMERLPDLLGMADIHLLPQRAGAGTMVMPSKLTGMLASGRPVVAMGDTGTELADVVRQCGVVVAPGDVQAFAAAIQELSDQPQRRLQLGQIGRQYASTNISTRSVLNRLENEMRALVDGPASVQKFS